MERSNPKYDAIVIGAGIAGMTAASELNLRGQNVLVIEHNHQPGGLMAGIRRKGYYFDVGCQSFENMGIIFPLLEQYGILSEVEFVRARYRLKMPGIDTVVYSLEQTRQEFKKSFPEFAEGFDRVFDVHERTSALIKRSFLPELIPFVKSERVSQYGKFLARMLPFAGDLKSLMFEDFEDWYKRLLPKSGVRDLLSTCGYSRMNVFVASAFWHLWAEDYWYPRGGFGHLFATWEKKLTQRGVTFLYKQRVTAFDKKNDNATAVVTQKGERFEAKQIVYCGDYKKGMSDLVGLDHYSESEKKRLAATKHSDALLSVYLGLNFPREELKKIVKAAHIFYFPNNLCRTAMDLGSRKGVS